MSEDLPLVRAAADYAPTHGVRVDCAVKEALHAEILEAIFEADYTRQLAFIGGTALRICHKGDRFSEDLDFNTGTALDENLMGFIDLAVSRVQRKYGLEIEVVASRTTLEEFNATFNEAPAARDVKVLVY